MRQRAFFVKRCRWQNIILHFAHCPASSLNLATIAARDHYLEASPLRFVRAFRSSGAMKPFDKAAMFGSERIVQSCRHYHGSSFN